MPRMHRPPAGDVRLHGDGAGRRGGAEGAGAAHRRPRQRRALRRAQLRRQRLLPRGGEGVQDDRTS